jgi:hypothetical protein
MSMAMIEIMIEVPDDEAPTSHFKARALLKRLRPVGSIDIKPGRIFFRARAESLYSRCDFCLKTFRIRRDGHVVRHGCRGDEE